jgi:hypothetical protein
MARTKFSNSVAASPLPPWSLWATLTTLLRCPDSPSTRTRSLALREESQVMLPVPYSRRAVDTT